MELKIVKHPLQDNNTKLEDLEHVDFVREDNHLKKIVPTWCVKSYIYRESDGGIQLFFKEIEKIKPDIIYLYEIKFWKDKIVNRLNEEDWFEDILCCVRCDIKNIMINK